jgi:hypothetical protein
MAAVFGEIFDDQVLSKVNIWPQIPSHRVRKILEDLSLRGVVEIIGIENDYKVWSL